ncbi:MAG: hypothetical protein ACP5KB_00150 [Thermoprotei archaeon]
MTTSCYSEALRLVKEAVDSYFKYKKNNEVSELRHALASLIRSYVLLLRGHYLPELDLTNLASVALDEGIIDRELYSDIVTSNLILNGYLLRDLSMVEETFNKLLNKLSEHDPYVSQQMYLFRY